MSGPRTLAIGMAYLALSAVCGAADFTSPDGFRLSYPDDWQVVSKTQQRNMAKATKSVFRNGEDADVEHLAVMILHPGDARFNANINVNVAMGLVRVDDEGAKALRGELSGKFASIGLKPSNWETKCATLAGRDAVSIRLEYYHPTLNMTIRQWLVFVPGRSRTYVLTASALIEDWSRFEPQFAAMANSLEVDVGLLGGWFNLSSVMQSAIIGGVVGGIAGAVAVLLKMATKRPKPTAPTPQQRAAADTPEWLNEGRL
jgi:hypothetical protein